MVSITGTIFEVLQYGSLLLAILTVIFILKRSKMNGQWLFDIPMLLLMLHGIIYYVYLFGTRLEIIPPPPSPIFFTPWSTMLRFHGYATLLIIAITNYMRERKKLWKI